MGSIRANSLAPRMVFWALMLLFAPPSLLQGAEDGGASPAWKTVSVLVDEESANEMPGESYGRFDMHVQELLNYKEGGYFIELGAFDGFRGSHTLELERSFGWHGLCIEGNRAQLSSLVNRRCDVVSAIVSSGSGELVEFESDGVHDGASRVTTGNPRGSTHTKRRVDQLPQVHMKTILKRFGAPRTIDFFSLDVEGLETQVLEGFPFSEYTPLIISVEMIQPTAERLLRNRGYKHYFDEIWIHESLPSFQDALDSFKTESVMQHTWSKTWQTYRSSAIASTLRNYPHLFSTPHAAQSNPQTHTAATPTFSFPSAVIEVGSGARTSECSRQLVHTLASAGLRDVTLIRMNDTASTDASTSVTLGRWLIGLAEGEGVDAVGEEAEYAQAGDEHFVGVFLGSVSASVAFGGDELADVLDSLPPDADLLCLSAVHETCSTDTPLYLNSYTRSVSPTCDAFILTKRGRRSASRHLLAVERTYQEVFAGLMRDEVLQGYSAAPLFFYRDAYCAQDCARVHEQVLPLCIEHEGTLLAPADQQHCDSSDHSNAIQSDNAGVLAGLRGSLVMTHVAVLKRRVHGEEVRRAVLVRDVSTGWRVPQQGEIVYYTQTGSRHHTERWIFEERAGSWKNDTSPEGHPSPVELAFSSTSDCWGTTWCLLELRLESGRGVVLGRQRRRLFLVDEF